MPSGAAAGTGSGAGAGGVQPVHEGDSDLRPELGPDISGMLDALAASADSVSGDLREQQAVR
jgi:hypothetical protein